MKNLLFILLFLFSGYFVSSQVMPEAFIGLLPPSPGDACITKTADRGKFKSNVDSISQLINDELDRRNSENEAKAESKESEMKANMMKKSGMSQEDIMRMQAMQKSKKSGGKEQEEMSEKETDAMVDKMLQENYNVSMGEIKNLDKMDENAKNAWATAYASEKKAEVMADPEKFEKERLQNMNTYELVAEQKRLMDSLNAQQEKFGRMFNKLDEDTSGQVMLRNISKWQIELSNLMGIDYGQGQKMESLSTIIKAEKMRYCSRFSPRYIEILEKYFSFTVSSLQPYYRLELIQNQVTASHTGVDFDLEKGQLGLIQVKAYLLKLAGVYQYNLFTESEENVK